MNLQGHHAIQGTYNPLEPLITLAEYNTLVKVSGGNTQRLVELLNEFMRNVAIKQQPIPRVDLAPRGPVFGGFPFPIDNTPGKDPTNLYPNTGNIMLCDNNTPENNN